jgi:hypothetical protein
MSFSACVLTGAQPEAKIDITPAVAIMPNVVL